SISYKFGSKGGLITFAYPQEKRPDTKSDLLALGFISSTDNAVLVRIDSGSSNDYMELEIVSMLSSILTRPAVPSLFHCADHLSAQ
ncbi:hypothetical protein AVEN_228031-1, partial [Araneus ventricosus]